MNRYLPHTTTIVATEDILKYQPVLASGKVANSTILPDHNKVVGLAFQDINNNFSGEVQIGGLITNHSWNWQKGEPIFINGSLLSNIPPGAGWSQQIGIARDIYSILIDIKTAYLL